ncbi:MAG: hypothetical protein KatS3mg023_3318 [Armatimonadota bacterium]|nr:MAG: hypothetical protein KatS3mg023_3318 [Armatimonadota bacterium]
MVEQQKPLEGGSWTTSALYLQGISLVRRNSEWHHFDPLGTAGVITNGSAQVVSNNLYDLFGVLRYQQGSAQTPRRAWHASAAAGTDEDLSLFYHSGGVLYLAKVQQSSQQGGSSYDECMKRMKPIMGERLAAVFCLLFHWLFPVPKPPQPTPTPPTPPPSPPGIPPPVQPPVHNPCPKGMNWIQVNCTAGSLGRCIPDKDVEKWHACCRADGTLYIGTDSKQCEPKPQKPATEPGTSACH